eukprot:GHVO01070544.1.p1 GENE.GHVO01070544.1~~GHVO01070544.1.p1  ORF type:complete len:102 (+),score=4.67 GHVO01070544.1:81-386(+)
MANLQKPNIMAEVLLDSGAQANLIDYSFAAILKLPIRPSQGVKLISASDHELSIKGMTDVPFLIREKGAVWVTCMVVYDKCSLEPLSLIKWALSMTVPINL